MTEDATLALPDGRTLGYADFGEAGGVPVLWCHGGPGSRMEAKFAGVAMAPAGFRVVGVDRPGYGLSTPRPGRTIEASVPDYLAVADAIGADEFYVVGVSTGGAYALATAAVAPERVLGVIAACALTDMRNEEAKNAMLATGDHLGAVWNAANRDAAIAAAVEQFGEDGSRMFATTEAQLAPNERELFDNPVFRTAMLENAQPMFAWGVEGYVDDRLADGAGWVGFEVSAIRCPVIIAHGDSDFVVPVETASVTAAMVPNASLRVFEGDGHFSVGMHIPALLGELRG